MLWGSQLKLLKKIAATLVLGAGVFVLVCATLKSVFVLVVSSPNTTPTLAHPLTALQDPINGAQLAGEWGTRETFVATVTTNLPMLFQLFRSALNFLFGNRFGTTQNIYKSPSSGFPSYGAGNSGFSRNRRGVSSSDPTTVTLTYNDSEERIVDGHKMHDMKVFTEPTSPNDNQHVDANGIVVSNQIEVTSESRSSHNGERGLQVAREPW